LAQNYFKRYLWLLDTIKRHGHITLAELSRIWELSPYNTTGEPLSERTFHNHRIAIEETFGINIDYERPDGYYISTDDMEDGSIKEWLLDCVLVNNLVGESASMHNRILTESIPSSGQWLSTIIHAMKIGKAIEITYKSFWKEKSATFTVHPYCLKLFRQRWYLLARSEDFEKPRIYALDRIENLSQSKLELQMPKKFDAREFFDSLFGVIAYDNLGPCFVKLRADSTQSFYLKSLPLHHSQKILEETNESTVFQYYLSPTFDFKQELLRYGAGIEVIEPKELRDEIISDIKAMSEIYGI